MTTIYRLDYQPLPYIIPKVDLHFSLDIQQTVVTSQLWIEPQHPMKSLYLDGENQHLVQILINQKPHQHFTLKEHGLLVEQIPQEPFVLSIQSTNAPDLNTSLLGLFVSHQDLFTQCEAEGFRRITFFPDRPDVMSLYDVTLEADVDVFPVLLSNGNLIATGPLTNNRHFAKWQDPFAKPCYLFALVAGRLVCREQTITTQTGLSRQLQVWAEKDQLSQTEYAMESLIHSIRWDEKRFNLPLDLERFMVVAVADFNAGAMENKGLNIFNAKYVLANPDVATDADYDNILSIIGHEYFHNWTGNRVTCRDWFQLSLKEGLTVFRDQEFSSDMMSTETGRVVCRIENVRYLKQTQFAEDAGPMAHPIRPDSYQEISNFYTVTVYEKGAEVVRLYHTLLGEEGFQKGMACYFKRHDGQACTCEDFLNAMADANHVDLSQFSLWYSQAGTPRVSILEEYDEQKQQYTLHLTQQCPDTPGQTNKKPMVIPCVLGLLSQEGQALELHAANLQHVTANQQQAMLVLTERQQSWTFEGVAQKPTPSLFRNFSAPVLVEYAYSTEDLIRIARFDSDGYNRWDAMQRIAFDAILLGQTQNHAALCQIFKEVLLDQKLDNAFKALLLTLPSEGMIADNILAQKQAIDPLAIHQKREKLRLLIASTLETDLQQSIRTLEQIKQPFKANEQQAGVRSLKHILNAYLVLNSQTDTIANTVSAYEQADNLTDRLGALQALGQVNTHAFTTLLNDFYNKNQSNSLTLDRWFTLQATRPLETIQPSPTDHIRALLNHPDFIYTNPNRARSVLYSYFYNNPASFHLLDGSGYRLWLEQIMIIDPINPQLSARLARSLEHWRNFAQPYKDNMQDAWHLLAQEKLSNDLREIVDKALK